MSNSIAYVLSKNTYSAAGQSDVSAISQGTQVIYATTSSLTNANILYADSKLTQPIYGDGTSWYGVALLTNKSVKYSITIDSEAAIVID